MTPIRWLNRPTNDLIWWADSPNAWVGSVRIRPLVHEVGPEPDGTDAEQIDADNDMHQAGKKQNEQSGDDCGAGGQHFNA